MDPLAREIIPWRIAKQIAPGAENEEIEERIVSRTSRQGASLEHDGSPKDGKGRVVEDAKRLPFDLAYLKTCRDTRVDDEELNQIIPEMDMLEIAVKTRGAFLVRDGWLESERDPNDPPNKEAEEVDEPNAEALKME